MAKFCGGCGTQLDPETGLCPNRDCNCNSKAPRQIETGNPPKPRCLLIVIVLLVVTLGTTYGLNHLGVIKLPRFLCLHEWQDATCTFSETCRLCGKSRGEPLDHDWQPATCTTMQSCRVCSATKGTPKGHTLGDWRESNDILHAKLHREQSCTVCGSVINEYDEALTSFTNDNVFIFSPQEFIDRMERYAKESYPDFRYTIDSINTGSAGNALFIRVYPNESSTVVYGLSFRGANGAYFLKTDLNTSQIQGVCLEKMCEIDVKTGDGLDPIDFQLAEAFYRACDPVVSEDDLYTQHLMHLCTFANWVDNNKPIGNTEMNGIQYAFQYSIGKSGGQYIDVESIQAFAAKQLS